MADEKIGEGMIREMAERGLEELRAAVLQEPMQEAPSYEQQMAAAAEVAPSAEMSMEMER